MAIFSLTFLQASSRGVMAVELYDLSAGYLLQSIICFTGHSAGLYGIFVQEQGVLSPTVLSCKYIARLNPSGTGIGCMHIYRGSKQSLDITNGVCLESEEESKLFDWFASSNSEASSTPCQSP